MLQVAAAGHGVLRARGGVESLAADRAAVTAVAVVTGDPIVLPGRGDRPVVLREATVRVLDARGMARASAPVLLTGDPAVSAPGWRATVRVHGRLGPTDRADDRVATLSVSGPPEVLAPPGPVASAAERLRTGLRRTVAPHGPDARGLLPGLVIGDTCRTPADLTAAMRATGMTHLSAVSGSNVTIVPGSCSGCASWSACPGGAPGCSRSLALAGFVVLARPEPRVLRAAVWARSGCSRWAGPALGGAVRCSAPRCGAARRRPVAGPLVRLRAVLAGDPGPAAVRPPWGARIGAGSAAAGRLVPRSPCRWRRRR